MIPPPNIASAVPQINFSQMLGDTTATLDRARRLAALSGITAGPDGTLNVDNAALRLLRAGDVEAGTNLLRAGQADRQLRRQMEAGERNNQLLVPLMARLRGQQPAAPGAAPQQPGGDDSHIPAGLLTRESGGRWDAQNAVPGAGGLPGHFGRVQFGQARLQDAMRAGILPAGTTPQQFMASPDLQRRAEVWHFNDLRNFIQRNGYDQIVGQNIGGVPVTMDGLLRVAHLGGPEGLRRFIASGGRYNPADANGTRLSDYLGLGGGQPAVAAAPASAPAPVQVAAAPATTATDAAPAPAPGAGVPLPPERPADNGFGPAPAPPAAMPPAAPQPAPAAPAQVAQAPAQGVGLADALPVLVQMANSPLTPEPQRQVINTLITQAIQDLRGPEMEREYQAYLRNGGRGSIVDFIRTRSGPPALQQATGADGSTYRGYVDPSAPPSAAFPQGGFRVVGGADRRETTYRDVRTPSGDTVTMEVPPDGPMRPPRMEGLPAGPSATSTQTFDREQAQAQSRRIEEIRTQGAAARQQIAALDETTRLMNTPGFFSGWGSQQRLAIGRALTALGLAPEQARAGAASMEAFRAMVNSNVLASLNGSLGAGVSNADVSFLTNTVPNLENTPEGNRTIVRFLRGVAERRVLVDRFARVYRAQNGGRLDDGFDNALESFASRNSIQELMRGTPYRIENDAEFRALPRGSQFMGPDGQLRRVP